MNIKKLMHDQINKEPRERDVYSVYVPKPSDNLMDLNTDQVFEMLSKLPVKPDYLDCKR